MTTKSWAFPTDHQNDAGFRAWVADLIQAFTDVGLVQTTDTGQIDTATVSLPGTSNDGGYAIFRFDDSQAGTAPIYIRFNFGTAPTAGRPRITAIIGTGSNGSGTITGTATSTLTLTSNTGSASGASFQNYLCHVDGFLGFIWNAGGATANLARGGLMINRSWDSSGDPTADGATIFYMNNNTSPASLFAYQNIRFSGTPAVLTAVTNQSNASVIPGPDMATGIGSDIQAFPMWGTLPPVYPLIGNIVVRQSEISESSTFSCTIFGSNERDYISVGRLMGYQWASASAASWAMAMLWE